MRVVLPVVGAISCGGWTKELASSTSDGDARLLFLCEDGVMAQSYSTRSREPLWVAYELEPEQQRRCQGGRKSFVADRRIPAGDRASANAEVWGPQPNGDSWDRGHLAPSYSFSYDLSPGGAWEATYRMSNVAPQASRFNRYSWRLLEEHVSDFVVARNQSVLVVTGVGFQAPQDAERQARDGVQIPDKWFKAVCAPELSASFAMVGDNVDERTPKGMSVGVLSTAISLADFEALEWAQRQFGGKIFADERCYTSLLDMGVARELDRVADALRIIPKSESNECEPGEDEVLLISEYVEGASFDKAIEVFNPTQAPVPLQHWSLRIARNGGDWTGIVEFPSVDLGPGQVFVVAHTRSRFAEANLTSSALNFNGNDAVGLALCDEVVDVVGVSGKEASAAGVSKATKDHVLERKAGIRTPSSWTASAGTGADDSQWVVRSRTAHTLGAHQALVEVPQSGRRMETTIRRLRW
mmetsp:Transcript_67712/g.180276  ORF Transcript_67712/g.180276 Transcript_67712/m.180276 type:complete len:469 (+) Transcript_67712:35-1441(+)